ncbi:MAG TPA: hypothetical protein VLH19_02625 [Patescibacteria group bacterium]|nr:hypothetical protein [Patescibacteria group bacterium]
MTTLFKEQERTKSPDLLFCIHKLLSVGTEDEIARTDGLTLYPSQYLVIAAHAASIAERVAHALRLEQVDQHDLEILSRAFRQEKPENIDIKLWNKYGIDIHRTGTVIQALRDSFVAGKINVITRE